MENQKSKITFVYNADGDAFSLLGDFAHKIFSPQTYNCSLCAITHGNFGMKNAWREYLKTLSIPFEFLHADEFKTKYKIADAKLPAVFAHRNGEVKEIIDAATIDQCRDINDLKSLINAQIERFTEN